MALAQKFNVGFFTGGAQSLEVPGRWPMSLNGRTYIVDMDHDSTGFRGSFFNRSFIPVQKAQQDQALSPTEASLSNEDLWRRAIEDWSHGAGQVWADRSGADGRQYRSSKGIDPWTKWALALLNDTGQKRASANTNLALVSAGVRCYIIDGNKVAYTTDLTTFTDCTGLSGTNPTSIASDGKFVYTAHTAAGIFLTNNASAATAAWITGTVTLVRYLKGRLMAANGPSVYNVTTSTATAGPTGLPGALFTHANSDFTWVDMAEGPSNIYLAGYSGDKSILYRTAVKPDGTSLDAPQVAGELPDGEIVRSIQGYLGFLLIGTDKGVRLAAIDSSGNLTLGSLITTPGAVLCFEPQDRFVWFGYTNYDTTSTGLGRIDLSAFTSPLTPAYASDLMVTGQGSVLSVITFTNIRVFAISGLGFYASTTNLVSSGTLDSGLITYGISDPKVSIFYDLRHAAMPTGASVVVSLATDGGTLSSIGTSSTVATTQPSATFQTNTARGETFETRLTLARATNTTAGPSVRRGVLRSYPAPSRGRVFTVPVLLYTELRLADQEFFMDPRVELDALEALALSRSLVSYQERSATYSVFVEDVRFIPYHATPDGTFNEGTCVLTLHSPGQ